MTSPIDNNAPLFTSIPRPAVPLSVEQLDSALMSLESSLSLSAPALGKGDEVSGAISIKRKWSLASVFCPRYEISVQGQPVGTLTRCFSVFQMPTYELKGASGEDLGTVHQKFLTYGFSAVVKDTAGAKVGTVQEDILNSLAQPSAVLRLKDGNGQLLMQSTPQWLTFVGKNSLQDAKGQVVGEFESRFLSFGDRAMQLDQPLERRMLLAFIASQIEGRSQKSPQTRAVDTAVTTANVISALAGTRRR